MILSLSLSLSKKKLERMLQPWPKISGICILFIYLEFFNLYCFYWLHPIGYIIHKFKKILKQRIIYNKCQVNF